MRNAFVKSLAKFAKRDKNIRLLTGDLGFSVFEDFKKNFPDQYLNCGIAEQNMIGVAAGLALNGRRVFVYSIVPFATMRCFEQIRNDICIQNLDVKIVGVGSGFSYSKYGPSHHSITDIGIMKTLPNMIVLCPSDPVETELSLDILEKIKSPAYLRLGRNAEAVLNTARKPLKIGEPRVLREGKEIVIFGIGPISKYAVQASDILESKYGIKAGVISLITVKPINLKLITNIAEKTKGIFTLEEHNIIGGVGESIGTIIAENQIKTVFKRFGINDLFVSDVDSQEGLLFKLKLSPEAIAKKISGLLVNF